MLLQEYNRVDGYPGRLDFFSRCTMQFSKCRVPFYSFNWNKSQFVLRKEIAKTYFFLDKNVFQRTCGSKWQIASSNRFPCWLHTNDTSSWVYREKHLWTRKNDKYILGADPGFFLWRGGSTTKKLLWLISCSCSFVCFCRLQLSLESSWRRAGFTPGTPPLDLPLYVIHQHGGLYWETVPKVLSTERGWRSSAVLYKGIDLGHWEMFLFIDF